MRSHYADVVPGAMKAMVALVHEVRRSPLEHALVELVKIRASKLNGCAYCVDTHVRAAGARGEVDQRLHLLSVWRGAPCYSDRERAARPQVVRGADADRRKACLRRRLRRRGADVFQEEEVVTLTSRIVSINGFNRLAVAFRQPVEDPPAVHLKAS